MVNIKCFSVRNAFLCKNALKDYVQLKGMLMCLGIQQIDPSNTQTFRQKFFKSIFTHHQLFFSNFYSIYWIYVYHIRCSNDTKINIVLDVFFKNTLFEKYCGSFLPIDFFVLILKDKCYFFVQTTFSCHYSIAFQMQFLHTYTTDHAS